jgi:trimeric autotransporter adhesin
MAGYTRNDTGNNIADGNVINAADLDGEFDSIQTAFNETSGHTHDGTVGEGAPISVVGPAQDINVTITEVVPKTTNTMSLGTAALQFKDLYIDGTANIDSLVADTADINGGTIDGATIATSDITVGAGKTLDVSAGTLTLANDQISGDNVQGGTIGSTTITTLTGTTANVTDVNATTVDTTNIEVTNIKAKDGTAAATIADTTGVVTIPSAVLTTADINGGTIDNVTIATSDVTVGAGKTLDVSAGTLTLADDQISGDKIQGGTIGSTTITTLTSTTGNITNVNATTVDTTNIEATNIKAKDGTASATIADSTGVMTVASSVLTTTDINGGTIDGVTIGGAVAGAGTFTSVTGTSLDMNGNADFSGNINLSQVSNTTIKRSDNTGFLTILGGVDALSSSLVMYGNAHATLPSWTTLEGDTMIFRTVDNTDFMRFVDGTGAVFNEGGEDLDFRIESDTLSHAFFLKGSDGYVGIGTGSPAEKLEVTGNIILDATDANIKIKSGVAGTAGAVNFTFNTDSTVYGSLSLPYDTRSSVGLLAQSANAYPVSIASGTASSATNAVILSTSGEEALRVDYLRRVGIGTSSPQARLDVTDTTGNQLVVATNTNAPDTEAGILFKHDTGNNNFEGGGIRSVRNGSTNDFGLALDVGRNAVSTEALFISGADATPGYVGIGTSSPMQTQETS